MPSRLSQVTTVLFDLDGTLTVPVIDFDGLRLRLGTPPGVALTEALNALPVAERDRGFEVVREAELEAAQIAKPSRGAVELVDWLHESGYATAIITRNFRDAVDLTLDALGVSFDVVITRDCTRPKPAPDAVLEALRRLHRDPASALMVGDFHDDMEAGRAAGTLTCLVTNGADSRFDADLTVPWLEDLHSLLVHSRK
ncbi:MAG: HAD family hydrolase [Planctomycetes bacterium]|nr:HAD family hydrolase [Planctomycetota bacterium]